MSADEIRSVLIFAVIVIITQAVFIFPDRSRLVTSRPAMESAIDVLVSRFKMYAGSDGAAETLSREEFHKLVESELPNFVKVRTHCRSR